MGRLNFTISFKKAMLRKNVDFAVLEELLTVCGFIIRLIEVMGIDRNVGGLDAVIIEDERGIQEVSSEKLKRIVEKTQKE